MTVKYFQALPNCDVIRLRSAFWWRNNT